MGKRVSNLSNNDVRKLHGLVSPVIDRVTGEQAKTSGGRLKYRGVKNAATFFGVSRQTIYNWLYAYPEKPENDDEAFRILDEIAVGINSLRGMISDVRKYFEGSVVVDLMALRVRHELLGESPEELRKHVLEVVTSGGKDKGQVEERLEALDKEVYRILRSLHEYRMKVNRK